MRTHLLDLPVDIVTHAQTVALAVAAMEGGRRCQHVALNVAKLVKARNDTELARDIRESDIVGIDGMGIVVALRMLGHDVPHRVAGADLFETLIAECAQRGLRPFLLGATPQVLDAAVGALMRRFPRLQLAGCHHGYFGPEEEEAICALIEASGAHCLFIAMPTPRKERFMNRHRDRLAVPFIMGIGGTLDVVGGLVRRAPRCIQRAGLEWAFRLAQEPRRLAWRYLSSNAVFAALMAREMVQRSAYKVVQGRARKKERRVAASRTVRGAGTAVDPRDAVVRKVSSHKHSEPLRSRTLP
jgi:N-acetylglucosaminyldiphosphoundecaprenol N-acetyl-beta-D-mannosaminyltransferase